MKLDIHHYFHVVGDFLGIGERLDTLTQQGAQIMASQEEAAAQLAAVNEKLVKIGTETSTLLTKIAELQAALEAAGQVAPELQAAIDAVAAQAGVVDDLVPDA